VSPTNRRAYPKGWGLIGTLLILGALGLAFLKIWTAMPCIVLAALGGVLIQGQPVTDFVGSLGNKLLKRR
jgi:hypothetical protein